MSEIFLFCVMCLGHSGVTGPERAWKPEVTRGASGRFDSSWWARAYWLSSAFDSATTGLAAQECRGLSCGERNPMERLLIGRRPEPWRLAVGWAAESAVISLIPNRKLRRIAKVGGIGLSLSLGAHNLYRWH